MLQLQSFESIGNKSEHSISSSQKSNQSNSRASYNSSSEKATKSINHDNDNEINQNNSHYRMNEISDMYNNSNTVNNSINITGTGAGSVKIGSHSSNNNSSNDECSINTNNNSSNHSSNSSIHRSTDIRSSRSIQRTHAPEGDDSSTGNMKTSLHDDGLIAIDSSRSRFNT